MEKITNQKLVQALKNFGSGAFRGAGSIGATLLAPLDAAARAVGVQNDFIGRSDRRQAMDRGLMDLTGANPESNAYQAGKIATEIAGTLPVGGMVAKGVSLIPGVAKVAPGLVEALRTGGIGGSGSIGSKVAGGAISGAVQGAAIDPDYALGGAAIGGALPLAAIPLASIGRTMGPNAIASPGNRQLGALKIAETLDTVNPTGTVFTKYAPESRASMPLGKNITSLAKTMDVPDDELITIYRGVPSNISKINPGDFVTTNQQLAKDYAGSGKVISKQVPAKYILDDISDPLGEEYIYRF